MTNMNHAAQKRACCQHDRGRFQRIRSPENRYGYDSILANLDVRHLSFDNVDTSLIGQQFHNRQPVELPVRLSTRASHGRTFRAIEHLEVNACPIDRARHDTVKRIDLPDQMPFPQSADRRIA